MLKFVITFVRKASYEVEVEAKDEDEARRMFLNAETAGEQVIELMEDAIVKVDEIGVDVEPATK